MRRRLQEDDLNRLWKLTEGEDGGEAENPVTITSGELQCMIVEISVHRAERRALKDAIDPFLP